MTETRVCSRCGERQGLENFYFVSKKTGMRRGECKACMAENKKAQKDPNWKPTCSRCGKERERVGPGRRLCGDCYEEKYDAEDVRANGSHRLKLKPCGACGAKRLREDHTPNTALCPICRSIPTGRRTRLRVLYNMNPREYLALLDMQGHRCAICQRKPKSFHVDHSHSEPRVVRGAVCNTCNTLLGAARDKATRLRAAADYLESPPAQQVLPGKVAHIEANRRSDGWRKLTRVAA